MQRELLVSQYLIDKHILKEKESKATKNDAKIGISEEQRGCIYNRCSLTPELWLDKAQREFMLKDARWESIPVNDGCWVQKAYKILQL